MNTKTPYTLTIDIPTGYEIDKTNSTFERIVFKSLTPVLPKRWKDIKDLKGFYVLNETGSTASFKYDGDIHSKDKCRDVWPTRELAEASIALAQLCQLRDMYNNGWIADWKNGESKHIIYSDYYVPTIGMNSSVAHVLAFKSFKLRDEFFTNFKDLLEIAKPLL